MADSSSGEDRAWATTLWTLGMHVKKNPFQEGPQIDLRAMSSSFFCFAKMRNIDILNSKNHTGCPRTPSMLIFFSKTLSSRYKKNEISVFDNWL